MASQGDSVLHVPPLERNFLISPPGSPYLGWQQIREEGPSEGGILELSNSGSTLANSSVTDIASIEQNDNAMHVQFNVVHPDFDLPVIVVEDVDKDEDALTLPRPKMRMLQTSLPPMC